MQRKEFPALFLPQAWLEQIHWCHTESLLHPQVTTFHPATHPCQTSQQSHPPGTQREGPGEGGDTWAQISVCLLLCQRAQSCPQPLAELTAQQGVVAPASPTHSTPSATAQHCWQLPGTIQSLLQKLISSQQHLYIN